MLKFNEAQITAAKQRLVRWSETKIALAMRVMDSIAIDIVNEAKNDPGGFKDWTSNLRNSIGYVPAFYGKRDDVRATSQTKEDINGRPVEQTIYHAPHTKSGDTITVIVYAGMEYALYVEFCNGHYVIGGSWSGMLGRVRTLFVQRMQAALGG